MQCLLMTLFTIHVFLSFVLAIPVLQRDVFVPPVLEPGNNEKNWKTGTLQEVKWNVSNPPERITNKSGKIILEQGGRIDFENPLKSDFDIMSGHEMVRVPDVSPGCDYKIVVFGDSGNSGPKFCISN